MVSFALPDNFYLKTDPALSYENGMELLSFDREFTVDIQYDLCGQDAKTELDEILDGGYKAITPITSCELNGLHGYYVFYSCSESQYFELRFDLEKNTADANQLCILITTSALPGIRQAMQKEEVISFIKDVRREKQNIENSAC